MSDPLARIRESTRADSSTTSSRSESTSATRSGGSSRPGSSRRSARLIVCGMGGSAIGGLLARAALGDSLALPMLIFRDYELPPWTSPDRAILCSSYSGDTEETLACFEAAEAIGATRYVMTTGGALADAARRANVPVVNCRPGCSLASIGYGFTVACEVAALVGAAPGMRTEIDTAAAHLDQGPTRSPRAPRRSPTDSPTTHPDLRLRPHRARRLPVGRRSTKTPSSTPSTTSSRSSTTTRSSAGPGTATGSASRRYSSPTPISIPASASEPS